MYNFKLKDIYISLIIFFLGVISRAPFMSKFFTFGDGPEFAIAMEKYSPKDGFPVPYTFLYVIAANAINLFLKNANASFVFMSVVSSGLFAVAIFWLGLIIFDRLKGLWAAFIILTAPWLWYYGITFFPFTTTGFFSACSVLGFYIAVFDKNKYGLYWGSVAFALLCGWRSQDFLFTAPLFLFTLFSFKNRIAFKAFILFVLVCSAWLIPSIYMAGGVGEFFQTLIKFSKTSRLAFNVFNSSFAEIKTNFTIKIKILILFFGIGIFPLLYQVYPFFNLSKIVSDPKHKFFAFWVFPAVIFYFIVFGDNPGYLIQSLSGLTIYLAWAIFQSCDEVSSLFSQRINPCLIRNTLNSRNLGWLFVSVLTLFNIFIFSYDFNPTGKAKLEFQYQSLPDTRKKDAMLNYKYKYIVENFDPENTVIISSNWYFMQNMYYLEKFHVYSYSAIILGNDIRTVKAGYSHTRKYYEKQDKSYEFDDNVLNAVIFDEDAIDWIQEKDKVNAIDVGGGYHIYLVKGESAKKIFFNYHKIFFN